MNKYMLEEWYSSLRKNSEHLSLYDAERSYSRKEVEQLSGKVYQYLKEQHIEKNDFVLLNFPRTSKCFIAMLGVAKVGAAFVVVESQLGPLRKEYIRLNTKCKAVIDEQLFDIIANMNYSEGYKNVDLHDAAFAIYTSGTTGNPKGVVHEYGNYSMLYESILDLETGRIRENEDTRFLNVAPFNFVASIMIFVLWINSGGVIFTPDYDVIKNVKSLLEFSYANKLNETFLSPSLIRLVGDKLNPEMKLVYTGSESANNVFIPNCEFYNLYLMSETAFILCQYKLDRKMEIAPIGKPNPGIEVFLSSEGEIVCKNPYCRGYINEGERDSFKDGFYYTGDLADIDANGNYCLKGRSVDMIKINGNRVEPLEVENVIKRILKNENCAVRGFEHSDKSYLCLYYVSDMEIDKAKLVYDLEQLLPYYMIPEHYIKIDHLPKTRLGKLDRKALLEPARVIDATYVAPTNDIEKLFCDAFQKTLNVKKIGIDTDLFEIGLDSITAIETVTALDIDGLCANDLYQTRTVRKLAKQYELKIEEYLTPDEKEKEGRKRLYQFSPAAFPIYYMSELSPDTTGINLSAAFKFNRLVDAERLMNAINTVTNKSSSFKVSVVKNADGVPLLKYSPEKYIPTKIEYMSESDVEHLVKSFVQPFDLLNELPYRIRLIKTKKTTYLFIDIHHIITDGMGMVEFGNEIVDAYLGNEISRNNFFEYCYDVKKETESKTFKTGVELSREKYLNHEWGKMPRSEGGEIYFVRTEHDTSIDIEKINRYLKNKGITRNVLFNATLHLVLAKMNKTNNNIFVWTYGNREPNNNQAGMKAVGFFHGIRVDKKMDILNLYTTVNREIQENIAYNCPNAMIPEIDLSELVLIDDLGDIEQPNKILAMVGKQIELARPLDLVEGQGLGYSALNFINRNKKLLLRLDTNNNWMNEKLRISFMTEFTNVMRRLISDDKSVIAEYAN